jgi:hypothetical protein
VLILVPLALEPGFHHFNLPVLITDLLVMLAGLAVMALTIFRFITIGKGTLAPWFPAGKLVVTGLYKSKKQKTTCSHCSTSKNNLYVCTSVKN